MIETTILLCEYTFKTGLNKNAKCGKLNCMIHDEYDGNLALFLNLPIKLLHLGEFKGFDYFTLVSMFNKAERCELTKQKICEYILYLTQLHGNIIELKYRILFSIYIFRFLDIDHVNLIIINRHNDFKNTVDMKLSELLSSKNTNNKNLRKYYSSTFETGKKFLSKQKNKTYLKNIFKRTIKHVIIANYWFQETLKQRYSPDGGIGFKLCFDSWTQTLMLNNLKM